MADGEAKRETLLPSAVGWIALILLDGYATFLHQGVGSPPGGWASLWWHPTSFLMLSPTVGGWTDVPGFGTAVLSAPAVVLAVVVFLGTRSAVARTLAITLVLTSAIFCLVGFTAGGTWELFHWRLSLVIVMIALAISSAVMSPSLSEALLRRGWMLRAAIYLPIAFAVVAVIRNATGTDENLTANFSPWPGIAIFGFEMGAYTIVGALLGLALGLGAITLWSKQRVVTLLGVIAAVTFPAIWFHQRFSNTEAGGLVAIAILSAIVLGLSSLTRGTNRTAVLTRRAAHFTLGATLVALPIFAGRAWANADYTVNKFVRARIATDALSEYYTKEGVYPEELYELTDQGYLEELPRPRVGFDFLYDFGFLPPIEFDYRGLGSSYVLEFNSTEWVQCAYNPPWAEDAEYGSDYTEEEEAELEDWEKADDESGEAWSCPDTRPELWGGDEREEGEEDEFDNWGEDEEEEEEE
jgi:hypothetical protein